MALNLSNNQLTMSSTQPVAQHIDPPGVDSQLQDESVAPPASSSIDVEASASTSIVDVKKPLANEGHCLPSGIDSQPQDESVAPPATESVAPPASCSIDVEAGTSTSLVVDVEKPHANEGYCTPLPPIVAVVIDEEVELDLVDSQQVDPPGKSYTEEKTSEEVEVDMLDEDDSLEVVPPAKKQKTQQKTHTYKSNYFPEYSNNKEYFSRVTLGIITP